MRSPDLPMVQEMERNLGLYRLHQLAAGALFWVPTLFLFLVSEFGLSTALMLQVVYYAAVVVLEVPSGWLSDRVGRTFVLKLVAISWIGAHSLFLFSTGLVTVLAAQVLLAAGYAFLSGTDVMLHFDVLEALGRGHVYLKAEALARQRLLYVSSATAVAGGALAMIDLRLPFVAALVGAILQFLVARRLVEPPRARNEQSLIADVASTMGEARQPVLRWLVLYIAGQVVVVHLAGELAAPYLTSVLGAIETDPGVSALMAGVVAAASALVAALLIRMVEPAVEKFGLGLVLTVAGAVPVIIVMMMAATTAVWVIPVLAFRGLQGAASSVLVPAIVGSRVAQQRRATFLSITSLVGRLCYAGVLVALWASGGGRIEDTLMISALLAAGCFVGIVVVQRFVPDFPRSVSHVHEHTHVAIFHDHLHSHSDKYHVHVFDPENGADSESELHSHAHEHLPRSHAHEHTSDIHHDHVHS